MNANEAAAGQVERVSEMKEEGPSVSRSRDIKNSFNLCEVRSMPPETLRSACLLAT
jgi:hypothetical protein